MIRNLKALGLALVAMLAMGAMAASAAHAENNGVVTAEKYPAFVHATGNPTDFFEAFGRKVTCPKGTHYKGSILSTAAVPSSTITVTPEYTQSLAEPCLVNGEQPATVTHNGCNFLFHIEKTTEIGEDTYGVKTDIECPTGQVIEVHVYLNKAEHEASKALCTITVPPQVGIPGLHASSMTVPVVKDLTLSGKTTESIHAIIHRNSILCPKGESEAPGTGEKTTTIKAWFSITPNPITVTGTTEAGGENGIQISHN